MTNTNKFMLSSFKFYLIRIFSVYKKKRNNKENTKSANLLIFQCNQTMYKKMNEMKHQELRIYQRENNRSSISVDTTAMQLYSTPPQNTFANTTHFTPLFMFKALSLSLLFNTIFEINTLI
ncbi:hypothetical protein DOY81_004923 [Sarcophaga bullata]|nr:hypothetical protein DOY81_004923 [Sarcophaga bullata]